MRAEIEPGDTQRIVVDRGGDKRGRVVLIVGAVGAGKTTFVTKVMRERAKQGKNVLVNLIDETVVSEINLWRQLSDNISQSHSSLLEYESLRKAFHRQLEQLRKGPKAQIWKSDASAWLSAEADELTRCTADPSQLVVAIFKMLRSEHTPVVVFLDNVDRLMEDHQRTVYSFAHKLSAQSGCTTIVPIRETTYYRAKEDGFLDVRTSDAVYHLQSPDVMQVLSRRLKYVERQLSERDVSADPRIKEWRRQLDWPQFSAAMVDYAQELKTSLLIEKTGLPIVTILAAVAWHSIRRLFRVLRHVHGMLHSHSLGWSLDNVVGTLIAPEDGAGAQFISTDMFVSPAPKSLAHLIRLRMLLFLRTTPTFEGRGGTTYDRLVRTMRTYGYRRSWIETCLQNLVRVRLLECLEIPAGADPAQKYVVNEIHTFRISALGILMTHEVLKQRSYLAAAGWSMSFLSEEVYTDFIREGAGVRDLVMEESASVADLLASSKLGEIVATYLHDLLPHESVQSPAMRAFSDIANVEAEIDKLIRAWRGVFPALNEEVVAEVIEEAALPTPQMILPGVRTEREPRITRKPADLSIALLAGERPVNRPRVPAAARSPAA